MRHFHRTLPHGRGHRLVRQEIWSPPCKELPQQLLSLGAGRHIMGRGDCRKSPQCLAKSSKLGARLVSTARLPIRTCRSTSAASRYAPLPKFGRSGRERLTLAKDSISLDKALSEVEAEPSLWVFGARPLTQNPKIDPEDQTIISLPDPRWGLPPMGNASERCPFFMFALCPAMGRTLGSQPHPVQEKHRSC